MSEDVVETPVTDKVLVEDEVSRDRICLNCGKEVEAHFCSWCGQNSKDLRISFKVLVTDFLSDVFTFDSKLHHTLKPLFLKPGLVTAQFIEGKRARFVPPLRLYIFCSIIFFLTLSFVFRPTPEVDEQSGTSVVITSGQQEEDNEDKQKNSNFTISDDRFPEDTWYGPYLNRKIDAQEKRLQKMDPEEAQRALLKSYFSMMPKALFFMMPFFALLMKVIYIRRDPLYIDHLIFAFHFHAFLYLFLAACSLAIYLLPSGFLPWLLLIMFLTPPIHLFLALLRVFDQGKYKTFLKFVILSSIYSISLFGAMLVGLIISIFLI